MNTSPERPGTTEDTSPTPLTLTKSLGDGSITGPMQYPNTDIDFTALGESWIYHDSFNWSNNLPQGRNLFRFKTDENDQGFIPWQIFHVGIAHYINYAWELGFLFVKLPDIRVSMGVIIRHTTPFARGYKPVNAPSITRETVLEINNESFVTAQVNPFWDGVMIQNHKAQGDQNAVNAYLPQADVILDVRVPYVPTNLQPKDFNVLVFKRLVNLSLEGTMVTTHSLPIPFRKSD